jgi:tRNA (guanine37-N1)-methyltransferase
MRIDVITLFPEILSGPLDASIMGRAQRGGQAEIVLHQLRDYAPDKHHIVDDKPYGGGPGMLLKCEPIFSAVADVQAKAPKPGRVILLTPRGARFNQAKARELATLDRIIFICGHYEGIDERVREHLVEEELCIGDFILTNGALAALVVIDAVVRLLPNVVGNEASTLTESFSEGRPWLEGPQYTRPEEFRGWRVPEILLSGHHGKIQQWSEEQSRLVTERVRPDLLEATDADRRSEIEGYQKQIHDDPVAERNHLGR